MISGSIALAKLATNFSVPASGPRESTTKHTFKGGFRGLCGASLEGSVTVRNSALALAITEPQGRPGGRPRTRASAPHSGEPQTNLCGSQLARVATNAQIGGLRGRRRPRACPTKFVASCEHSYGQ